MPKCFFLNELCFGTSLYILEVVSVKDSKISQNRELDTKKAHIVNQF